MGKASRTKTVSGRQEKIAAQRVAARRAEQKRRLLIGGGAVLAVLVIVVVFVVVALGRKSPAPSASNGPTGAALTSVVNTTTSVSPSTLDQVGAGSITAGMTAGINGTPLTANGHPQLLYVGAEYCPYCAAERWSMVVALSRFGTFSNLKTVHSSSTDAYANTPTFSFHGSSYTSQYLTFTPVEMFSNIPSGSNGYTTLDQLTQAENTVFAKWDAPPYVSATDAESYPFLDVAGKYIQIGDQAGLTPQTLDGMTWAQISAALSQPSSAVAKQVDGAANYLTAAICKATNNQPATACDSTIQGLEGKL